MSGKIAVVTGASRGIAKVTAELFRSQGMTVVGLARRFKDGGDVLHCDVRREESVAGAFRKIAERFGKIDILVNCAGIATSTGPLSSTTDEWEDIMKTNVIGMYLCCKYALEVMCKRKQGAIINVSSIAGRSYSLTASVPYTCSKYAVIGLTRQLAACFGKEGIRMNCVCPSQTNTEMLAENVSPQKRKSLADAHPLGRLAEPLEVAKTIAFLASDAASYMNGAVVDVNGGLR